MQSAVVEGKKKRPKREARYLYCVVESPRRAFFKNLGLEGREVYSIPFKDIGALVSRCPPEPYQSNDSEVVKEWLIQHGQAVDYFFERYDAVLPTAFDTIIKGSDGKVRIWLEKDYSTLKRKMEKIRGKQEFGVQIFYDSKALAEEVIAESVDIQRMMREIESKPRGLAYMYTQKLKEILKNKLEDKVRIYSNEFYETIRSCVDDVKVEKIKNDEGDQRMLMNLSCLTSKEGVPELAKALERINSMRNFSVKFTGPWPTYSFIT